MFDQYITSFLFVQHLQSHYGHPETLRCNLTESKCTIINHYGSFCITKIQWIAKQSTVLVCQTQECVVTPT